MARFRGSSKFVQDLKCVLLGGTSVLVPYIGYSMYDDPCCLISSWNEKKRNGWNYNWDLREPTATHKTLSEEAKQKPLMSSATRHIYLVRHAQYINHGTPERDRFLTELGRKQAAQSGERLRALNVPYTSVVNSTMPRSRETADWIFKALPSSIPRKEDTMLEEGTPLKAEPSARMWYPSAIYLAEGARLEAAFMKYFHRAGVDQKEDSHEIIISHGKVLRYFLCRLLQFPPAGWHRMSLALGSVSVVAIRPNGTVSVRSVGEIGFQPPDLVVYTRKLQD